MSKLNVAAIAAVLASLTEGNTTTTVNVSREAIALPEDIESFFESLAVTVQDESNVSNGITQRIENAKAMIALNPNDAEAVAFAKGRIATAAKELGKLNSTEAKQTLLNHFPITQEFLLNAIVSELVARSQRKHAVLVTDKTTFTGSLAEVAVKLGLPSTSKRKAIKSESEAKGYMLRFITQAEAESLTATKPVKAKASKAKVETASSTAETVS